MAERGIVTGVGSLPHVDPAAAAAFVLRTTPELPAAPALPRRSPVEGMLAQAAWKLRGVTVGRDGALVVDRSTVSVAEPFAPGDEQPEGAAFEGWNAFLDAVVEVDHPGAIKIQLAGPITVGLALAQAGLSPEVAFAAAGAAVQARGRAMLAAARDAVAPGARIVAVLDEPGFGAVGRLGFPLGTEAAIDLLSGALAAVEGPGTVTGVHCCAEADFGAVLRAGPQVLSLPLEVADLLPPAATVRFLERGGWVAWGAVPTDRPLSEVAGRYWRSLQQLWVQLLDGGVDREPLLCQSLITPACGLARHTEEQAAEVLRLCDEVGARLREQVTV